MTKTQKTIVEQARKLDQGALLALISVLQEMVARPRGRTMDELKAELDRRVAYADAHPEDRVSWDEIKRKWAKERTQRKKTTTARKAAG
ncbi:MAG: hypothetical protein IT462_04200 [Planctomycetes bacterium]|nr:hypothetical protein [Planctomycetota bacterium]